MFITRQVDLAALHHLLSPFSSPFLGLYDNALGHWVKSHVIYCMPVHIFLNVDMGHLGVLRKGNASKLASPQEGSLANATNRT
jgi:hypothetical protein